MVLVHINFFFTYDFFLTGASPYPQGSYPINPGMYPYQNGPSYGNGYEFQQIFDQYFRNLQAQQEAFQAQIQQQQQSYVLF